MGLLDILLATGDDDDLASLLGEATSNSKPNATGAACDETDLPFVSFHLLLIKGSTGALIHPA